MRFADLSLVSGNAKKPKNSCGAVLTVAVLPVALLIYTFTFFNDWFNANLGAHQETSITQLLYGTGIRMTGQQELYCIAPGGCWYTRYPSNSRCPPESDIAHMRAQNDFLVQMFRNHDRGRGPSGSAPSAGPGGGPGGGPGSTKGCAYAAQFERLEGVCLFSTYDPIDRMTITWQARHQQATGRYNPNFGVALRTETVRPAGMVTNNPPETVAADPVEGVASEWFDWSTDGGGRGYVVATQGTPLHFGDVELVIHQNSYEFASPKSDATQLIPRYGNTDPTPSSTNICYQGGAGNNPLNANTGARQRCQDDPSRSLSCAQLTLAPSPVVVTDTRTIISPLNLYLGGVGGTFSLLMLFLTSLNALLVMMFRNRFSWCTPVRAESASDVAVNGKSTASV